MNCAIPKRLLNPPPLPIKAPHFLLHRPVGRQMPRLFLPRPPHGLPLAQRYLVEFPRVGASLHPIVAKQPDDKRHLRLFQPLEQLGAGIAPIRPPNEAFALAGQSLEQLLEELPFPWRLAFREGVQGDDQVGAVGELLHHPTTTLPPEAGWFDGTRVVEETPEALAAVLDLFGAGRARASWARQQVRTRRIAHINSKVLRRRVLRQEPINGLAKVCKSW